MYVVTVTYIWRGILEEIAVVIGQDKETASIEAEKVAMQWAAEKMDFTPEEMADCEDEILSGCFSSGYHDLIIHHPDTVINLTNGEQK
ncbi:MAG: hypothetical protein WC279_14470 [Sulfurimonas sp.]|jgi:hypothetical protein|uniref:hypothetical protein n=1 Tax=Sulfurimonas sp. TaxID=2022749 RepID=UPI00356218D6